MKQAKRVLSVLLTLCLVLGLFPGAASAAGSLPFTDVKASDWYYDAAQYVYENGMMSGTGTDTFSPGGTTTRGMIVTVLHSMEGTPSASGKEFSDVPADQWYSKAVAWASANGIVSGYENGTFGPNNAVTREQMATILYGYAQYKGYDTSASGSIDGFADAGQVSGYAKQPLSWAVGAGLISGVGGNSLSPKGNATRGQIAVILMSFREHVVLGKAPEQEGGSFTVTFDLNYGENTKYDTKTVKAKGTVDKPANPTRSGYTFSGWYTEKSGGVQFDFKKEITSDLTLYAHWTQNTSSGGGGGGGGVSGTVYTVTFDVNVPEGIMVSNPPAAQNVRSGNRASVPSPAPFRGGYSFAGWFTDEAGTNVYEFNTPVTQNITLYAKWEMLTGNFTLRANKSFVMSGDAEVYLYLNAAFSGGAAPAEITLKYGSAGNLTESVPMKDDATDGDDMKNDGVYSAVVDLSALTADTELTFMAEYNGQKSKPVKVNFYTNISPATYAAMEQVEQAVGNIMTDPAFDQKSEEDKIQAVKAVLESCAAQGKIQEGSIAAPDKEHKLIRFQYPEGILGGVMYEEFEGESNGPDSAPANVPARTEIFNNENSYDLLPNNAMPFALNNGAEEVEKVGSAIILNSFPAFETKPEDKKYRTDFYNELKTHWDSKGLETTLVMENTPTVEDYKKLNGYNVIGISTHGSLYNNLPAICLAEDVKDGEYAAELKSKQIAKIQYTDGSSSYWILPSFFENQYSEDAFSGSFIFSECCMALGRGNGSNASSYDYTMAGVFTDRSAEAYIGFHNSVFATYARELMKSYVDGLIEQKTSQEAYDAAVQEWGANHKVWYEKAAKQTLEQFYQLKGEKYNPQEHIAYPVLKGNPSAVLVNEELKNGGFEEFGLATTAPKFWNCLGDVRTLTQLGPATPKEGQRMGLVTTGIGSQENISLEDYGLGDGTEGSILSQIFRVPENASKLTFEYNFISEEPMEYVYSQFNDAFVVQVAQGSSVHYSKIHECVNDSEWVNQVDVDFYGGDETAYETGWKTVVLDLTSLGEEGADLRGKVITLSFIVYDVGDEIFDSACVIDHVRLE